MLRASMRRIEVFVAVADAGGFSAAAERLGISQPSVSAHVRALERELGGPSLLERPDGRRPQLTEAGQAFLDCARVLLDHARVVGAEAWHGRRDAARRVTLACQPHITNFILPDALAGFVRDAPEIDLVLRTGASETVPSRVRDGTADLGCMLGTPGTEAMSQRRIGEETYVLVAPPGDPLAGRPRITPAVLAVRDFVCGPRNAALTREISVAVGAIGLSGMRVVARASEYNMRRAMVQAGVGLLWTPESSAAPDIREGRLVALTLDAPPVLVPIHLLWCSARGLTARAAKLADHLARHVACRRMSSGREPAGQA